ncbi:MAG: hypothetical protein GY729_12155 [Desulfobacteraceae bacterium]|nr:hypothetical protein [Desulfobacteraceae bacterium]
MIKQTIDTIFEAVDTICFGINDLFAQPAAHYCKLETRESKRALIADDGSLISVLSLSGNLKMIGAQEHMDMVDAITADLSSRFARNGHAIQIVMTYDPENARAEIKDCFLPSRRTARNLGIDIDPILDDWENSISAHCATEHVFVVLWTRPFILVPSEQKKARKQTGRNRVAEPNGRNIQDTGLVMTSIQDEHYGFVSQVSDAFKNAACVSRLLSCHEALWWVRHEVDPDFTSRQWRACLPGDRIPLNDYRKESTKKDLADLFYPSLKSQVFPREAQTIDRQTIKIGNKLHTALMMVMPPQSPKPFAKLFRSLKDKKMPFRASFLFDGDGLGSTHFKSIFSNILHITSTSNKMLNRALDELRHRELNNETLVRFHACFDTHVDAEQGNAAKTLSKRSAELAGCVQAWGVADCGEAVGDPLLAFSATIPCLMPTSPAPASVAPLQEVVHMMPFTRPASPWETGSIVLRTSEGKIMPYALGSSLQSAWIDIGVAPMGSGKSVWLNTINWGFVTQAGLSRLPWLSIIDIGPSSSGLISLLKTMLPRDQQYLAAYFRLKMTADYAINPFDTPLGCRIPLTAHVNFLVNLLALFSTPLDQDAPQDGIPGIAREVIKLAYEQFSDEKNPKLYRAGINKELDDLIQSQGFYQEQGTSWWEIVDFLFEKGYTHEALKAQRYAVPLLADVAGLAKRDMIKNLYKHNTRSGEPITDFFWRSCIEAIAEYPILKEPTRFDIGDAQIISLDLDEVAPRGGPQADRQTGVMYMLARQVVGGRFFVMPDDVNMMPSLYKEHHAERIKAVRQDPKRLCYDEVHRIARSNSVSKQLVGDLEMAGRESRKWNLHIGLYSQDLNDIPDIMLELATSIFILGSGTKSSVENLVDRLGLNTTAQNAIENIRKPDKKGASMVAFWKTSKGNAIHLLTNTIGMRALWAFSSTTEDVQVRNALYDKLTPAQTLKTLASLYPGGIKEEVEKRRERIDEFSALERSKDVLEELVEEIFEYALAQKRGDGLTKKK